MSIAGVARRARRAAVSPGGRRLIRGGIRALRRRGGRVVRVGRRRRRRGISATELRGYRKVSNLVANALMVLPRGRRGIRFPRRRRRLLGDPEDGD